MFGDWVKLGEKQLFFLKTGGKFSRKEISPRKKIFFGKKILKPKKVRGFLLLFRSDTVWVRSSPKTLKASLLATTLCSKSTFLSDSATYWVVSSCAWYTYYSYALAEDITFASIKWKLLLPRRILDSDFLIRRAFWGCFGHLELPWRKLPSGTLRL